MSESRDFFDVMIKLSSLKYVTSLKFQYSRAGKNNVEINSLYKSIRFLGNRMVWEPFSRPSRSAKEKVKVVFIYIGEGDRHKTARQMPLTSGLKV